VEIKVARNRKGKAADAGLAPGTTAGKTKCQEPKGQPGREAGKFGEADTLTRAKGTSVGA
jgi:hypothetical protein